MYLNYPTGLERLSSTRSSCPTLPGQIFESTSSAVSRLSVLLCSGTIVTVKSGHLFHILSRNQKHEIASALKPYLKAIALPSWNRNVDRR